MKKQRKHYTPEEKVAILRRHLVEAGPILGCSGAIGYITPRECSPGISRRFRPSGIGSWKRRGNSGRIAASGPRDG